MIGWLIRYGGCVIWPLRVKASLEVTEVNIVAVAVNVVVVVIAAVVDKGFCCYYR